MRLFHFSDSVEISAFHPRPLRVAVDRGPEREWLNGPLVWAIDEKHSLLYLFPRECPRIVVWPTSKTTKSDYEEWFGDTQCRAIAFIEEAWLEKFQSTPIFRYTMPSDTFMDIEEIGMWVSDKTVIPIKVDPITDLRGEMESERVEIRTLRRLTPLKSIWQTTLHASGIRTRNAQDWGPAGWEHSKPVRAIAS